MEKEKNSLLTVVSENIEKLKSKDFNVYFFVFDTNGNPSGTLKYIYDTAIVLSENGYKVTMLHQEDEYVGVGDWLGEKYMELSHKNIEKDQVELGPSDFLFVPEILSSLFIHIKKAPCKKIVLVQNYWHIAESTMPIGCTYDDVKVFDAITTTQVQDGILHEYFPTLKTHIVRPSIDTKFRDSDAPRKLKINLISKDTTDIKRIIKAFYWKYPMYKWVSFIDLRGLSQDVFCEALRESPITVWIDDKTNFGYSALEALRCGNIVLAKQPETFSDWNIETGEDGKMRLTDACIWFNHVDDVPQMLASVVRSWTLDKVPDSIYENMKKFDDQYTPELMKLDIEKVYEHEIFDGRIKEFEQILSTLKNNDKN